MYDTINIDLTREMLRLSVVVTAIPRVTCMRRYVYLFVMSMPPSGFRRGNDVLELGMGSPGQPVGDCGNFVHSFLQAT